MPAFSYTAWRNGKRIDGTIDAASANDARRLLSDTGLQIERLEPIDAEEPVDLSPYLSRDESVELGGNVATIVRSGLPLVSGLQALYAEIPSRWLWRLFFWRTRLLGREDGGFEGARRALREMIRRLEAGEPVERVIASNGAPPVPAIIRAGLRTDRLGVYLEQYLSRARESADRRRQVVLGLAYPVLLLFAGIAVLTAVSVWLIPQFKSIFADFGVELPGLTRFMISISDLLAAVAVWLFPGLIAALALLWAGLQVFGGPHARRRLIYRTPVIGDPWRFAALSEFSHLLAVLVEGAEPLPVALRACGSASHNPDLARHAQMLADDVERGTDLGIAARSLSELPPELTAFFHWAGQRESFVDGLRAAGDILDTRARAQIGVIAAVLEPVIILGVAGTIAMVLTALFLPLVRLLNQLS